MSPRLRFAVTTHAAGAAAPAVRPHRAFDPRLVASLESTAWVAYYRHRWATLLRAAILLTRHTFGWAWPATLWGAWLALRAIRLWSPLPDNDPDGARRAMERFYRLVARQHGESLDAVRASELEVEWWRVHRAHQYGGAERADLVGALAALYAYVYGVPEEDVWLAAEQRAAAMDHSDRWVEEGRDLQSPLIAEARTALVRSYAALLAAVHRA
jgi:hypothetical protein